MKRTSHNGRNNNTQRFVEDGLMMLAGIGAGLAAMYLLDPEAGRRRRGQLTSAAGAAMGRVWDHASTTASDLASDLKERTGDVADHLVDQAKQILPQRAPEHHYVGQTVCAIGSMLLGAGMTYLFDPHLGHQRRARLVEGAGRAVTGTAEFFVCAARSTGNWINGSKRFERQELEGQTQPESGVDPSRTASAAEI